MRTFSYLIILCTLSGCYKTLSLEGFNKKQWVNPDPCETYRLEIVDHLMKNQEVLLESSQNEVESLLGKANEHELYKRSQKFFHYRLSPEDSCHQGPVKYLSIRFNAIGNANDIQVTVRDL